MRKEHSTYLTDPITNEPLKLAIYDQAGEHVISGILTSSSNWYPIIKGVPRILVSNVRQNMLYTNKFFFDEYQTKLPSKAQQEWQHALSELLNQNQFDTHQVKTADSFAFEWENIYNENDYEKNNFFHFLSPFIQPKNLHRKITLDIGCGSGRFTKWAALSGAAIAFGTDLGDSVNVAYEMTKGLQNVCIIQADIYDMPFYNGVDIAYSIGVLHHLPNPKEGFLKLPKVLKKGGHMLIWVYNRRHNARAIYFYEPLRRISRHIPKRLLLMLCYIPAIIVHLINEVSHLFKELGLTGLAKRVPFAYYANFPFNMKLNDAFDVLATPKSNYYYVEQIIDWFTDATLKEVKAYEHPEAGITCIGTHA